MVQTVTLVNILIKSTMDNVRYPEKSKSHQVGAQVSDVLVFSQ